MKEFWLSHARAMPGVNDVLTLRQTVTVEGQEVKKIEKVPKLFVDKSQTSLYEDFKKENPEVDVGFKLFVQQAPFNIRTLKVGFIS